MPIVTINTLHVGGIIPETVGEAYNIVLVHSMEFPYTFDLRPYTLNSRAKQEALFLVTISISLSTTRVWQLHALFFSIYALGNIQYMYCTTNSYMYIALRKTPLPSQLNMSLSKLTSQKADFASYMVTKAYIYFITDI